MRILNILPVAGRKRLGFSGPRVSGRSRRGARTRALWPAGAMLDRKSATYNTEAAPPKSLEVEPGNEDIIIIL